MTKKRIVLNDCIWVYGERVYHSVHAARAATDAVKQRGLTTFMLKGSRDTEGLEQLRRLIWQGDKHVITAWLHPTELSALKPILLNRKNFSVIYDDWWIQPYWFTCHATFIAFTKYGGVATRLSRKVLTGKLRAPLFYNPFKEHSYSKYALVAAALRPLLLAASPAVQLANKWRREAEDINPERYLYFPYAMNEADFPEPRPASLAYEFDFINTYSVCGIFLMRDPFIPFHLSFANLYDDRLRLSKLIAENARSFYRGKSLNWDQYTRQLQRSKYVVVTGNSAVLDYAFNPKYLECAISGTPMFGHAPPFEAPWLDDCLFTVSEQALADAERNPQKAKCLIDEALSQHVRLQNNCLNLRPALFDMYNPHRLLDMLQTQMDGNPVPPGYLKVDLKPAPAPAVKQHA